MRVFALDTCFNACSVGLVDVDASRSAAPKPPEVLAHRHMLMARGHAEALPDMMVSVLEAAIGGAANTGVTEAGVREAGDAPPPCDRIAVTRGPGTFTGTRVGLSAARALALVWQVPVVGVGSLDAMALGALSLLRNEPGHGEIPTSLAVVRDARRGDVYLQVFDVGQDGLPEARGQAQTVAVDKIAGSLGADVRLFVGSGAALAREALATHREPAALPAVAFEELEPDALHVATLGVLRDAQQAPPSPFYARPPDAKPQEGAALARRTA
ncbi:MAG: tRNA (adenosine(37)-N6)-threonylcarbamoyltransferase complex dimerization subunit type 1 TsaB [Pseudomonadota bacterium]